MLILHKVIRKDVFRYRVGYEKLLMRRAILRVHVRRLLLPVRYAVRPSVVRVTRTGVAPRHVTQKRRDVPFSHFCLQLKVGSIYVNLIFITLLVVRLGFEPIRTAPSPHRATLLDPESTVVATNRIMISHWKSCG